MGGVGVGHHGVRGVSPSPDVHHRRHTPPTTSIAATGVEVETSTPRRAQARPRASETLTVSRTASRPEAIPADHVVLAADVRATARIAAASALPDPALSRALRSLAVAPPYAVRRLWIDRPTAPDRAPFYAATGFARIDLAVLHHLTQDAYADWARRAGGSVVELQSYCVPGDPTSPDAAAGAAPRADLDAALAELRGARVLHEEGQVGHDFSGFPPGSEVGRPGPRTAVPGLFLAGDWVRTRLPVALMEGAVAAGRLAANAICEDEDVLGAPLDSVPLGGLLP